GLARRGPGGSVRCDLRHAKDLEGGGGRILAARRCAIGASAAAIAALLRAQSPAPSSSALTRTARGPPNVAFLRTRLPETKWVVGPLVFVSGVVCVGRWSRLLRRPMRSEPRQHVLRALSVFERR